MPYYKTPVFLPWIYPSFLWRKPTDKKIIYLTFDDGPVQRVTDFVIEELEKYNAKATFFCVGENINKYPDVFHKVLQHQHQVANHTYNHLNGWKTHVSNYLNNVSQCENIINEQSNGKGQKLFRPPYGKIKYLQAKKLQDYQVVMWDVLTYDFDNLIPAGDSLKKSIRFTQKGSIVIFHDSFKAEKKLRYMLPGYLDHFAQQDYQFKTL